MKPYSQDLRVRVVAAYANHEGTQRELARRFHVSPSFVQGVLRHYRETGSLEPRPHGGGYPRVIDERGLELVARLVREHPTATLGRLCEEFDALAHYRPSRATMWRAVRLVKTLAKRPGGVPAAAAGGEGGRDKGV